MEPDSNIKILLVDDNENNLLSMEIVLDNQGYTFYKATSGREALRILLKEDDFTLILLDVKMPVMDGYETAELIYQRDRLKYIPIIFITAHDYEEEAMFKGYRAGAVDFIRKPFKPEVLRSKVAVFADLQRKNWLLRQQEEKLQSINNDLLLLNMDLERRVTERTIALEKLNTELRALNASKDKFLSVISHDLRNPLTSLLLAAKNLVISAEDVPSKDIHLFAGIIHRTSQKVLQQMNELIDWAKKQREKTSFNPEIIQLQPRISESLELLRANAIQKSIKLENAISEELYVYADSLMLRSILQNLVTNAIKFTQVNGLVRVTAQPVDEMMVEISVEDNGIGMSPETRERLLGDYNISSPGTDHETGSGIGLFLVKDFVLQHGGTIDIDSEPDKGTAFRFTVPANEVIPRISEIETREG
ncbi:MAG: hybrid sensor histidine kinase/response regulator [Mucilaginibacter sp.]